MLKNNQVISDEDIYENIFSFKGRIKRSTFWPWYLTFFAVFFFVPFLAGSYLFYFFRDNTEQGVSSVFSIIFSILAMLMVILMLLLAWVSMSIQVQRLHDRNMSGLHIVIPVLLNAACLIVLRMCSTYSPLFWIVVFMAIVSSLYFIFVFINYFLPGTVGPNRFGLDVRKYTIHCPECHSEYKVFYSMHGDTSVCYICKADFIIQLSFADIPNNSVTDYEEV